MEFEGLSRNQLLNLAREHNIKGVSKMKKEEIRKRLVANKAATVIERNTQPKIKNASPQRKRVFAKAKVLMGEGVPRGEAFAKAWKMEREGNL